MTLRTWIQHVVSSRRGPRAPCHAVAVAIDIDKPATAADIGAGIDELEEKLKSCVLAGSLGEYDGQEHLSSYRVLLFFAHDPAALMHAIMPIVRASPLRDLITVRPGNLPFKPLSEKDTN
jgi:hypothetical protein